MDKTMFIVITPTSKVTLEADEAMEFDGMLRFFVKENRNRPVAVFKDWIGFLVEPVEYSIKPVIAPMPEY